MDSLKLAELALWLPVTLLSITLHEAAHAWAGLRGGDYTAEAQATLNPLPHIRREPVGMLVAPIAMFWFVGWTLAWGSAPYDPLWAQRHPRRAAFQSAAGPLSNLLLAGISLGVIHILLQTGTLKPLAMTNHMSMVVAPSSENLKVVAKLLSILFTLNILLFVFNMFPVPPFDGAGVVQGLFPRSGLARALERAQEGGWSFLFLLGAMAVFYFIGFKIIGFAVNYGIYGGTGVFPM